MVQIRGTEVRVTIPIFPETARGSWGVVEGKSLKAGNKNKTTTKKSNLKIGTAKTEAGPQRWSWELREQQLRHALKWEGWQQQPTVGGGRAGRPWWFS